MSFKRLLKQRCEIWRAVERQQDGGISMQWSVVAEDVRCYLDLNFIRKGKDPIWTADAGRPSDTQGVGFFMPNADVRPKDRIKITSGDPTGTYELGGHKDEAIRVPVAKRHHYEMLVTSVPDMLVRR